MSLSSIARFGTAGAPSSPFAALNARAHSALPGPATQEAQGSYTAHLTLRLYGADGLARNVEGGLASLTGAKLDEGIAAVIEVRDANGGETTVSVRKDGTFLAVESGRGGGAVRYDSRNGDATTAAQRALAARAARIAGLAVSSGTAAALAAGAPGALAAATGPNGGSENVAVTITDANGVSRYAGGADGVVSAWRTTDGVALETVTIDHGVQTDAVRRTDGSGVTTVGGGALGGTTFKLSRDRDGTEHVDVTSGGGAGSGGSGVAAASAVDAFGDRITLGADAQGRANVQLTDAAGTAFTLNGDASGTSASLGMRLGVGDTSGTRRAEVVVDASVISSTGSAARTTSSLVATAHDDKDAGLQDGTLALAVDASVVSAKSGHGGVDETRSIATLALHAQAAGTLDVAGVGAARVDDGARDQDGRPVIAGGTSREAKGGVSLDHAASREILAVEVTALGDDLRSPASPQSSITHDDATIAIDAFGRRSGAMRHDDITRNHNHVSVDSSAFP